MSANESLFLSRGQGSLVFEVDSWLPLGVAQLGTFQDSLRSPIHRWFKYPAGFSYRLVEAFIDALGLNENHWILDPFAGCGTVNVVAKQRGVNVIGIEAHPFVWWVATVKCFWEFDLERLHYKTAELLQRVSNPSSSLLESQDLSDFPPLVHKCFSEESLRKLRFIRETIFAFDLTPQERNLLLLALIDTLRTATGAGAGWPYIAPTKHHAKRERDPVGVFCETVKMFIKDLTAIHSLWARKGTSCQMLLHDARQPYPLDDGVIDLAITSPPYLNNYDYADRTRLELYFLGQARSWREITEQVRERLITSTTSQVRRSAVGAGLLSDALRAASPFVYNELLEKTTRLAELRCQKGGKKSYDLVVTGYFNDMVRVLQQVYRVLARQATFALVLGDSAPYGVHIPTDEYLAKIALGIGFRDYAIHPLRHRGVKWRANSRRHGVPLREVLLTLFK